MATPAHAGPVRKKRNFKALQLDVSQPPPQPQPEPIRVAPMPAGGGKKRPPPMQLKAPKVPAASTANVDTDSNLLTVNGSSSAPPTGSASAHRMTYHTTLSTTLANLELNSENKYHDLRNEDLKDLHELGQGNGGSVKKVEHLPTGTIMAKKVDVVATCTVSSKISSLPPDCLDRRKAVREETDPPRTPDHARLPLRLHHLLLWRVHLGP